MRWRQSRFPLVLAAGLALLASGTGVRAGLHADVRVLARGAGLVRFELSLQNVRLDTLGHSEVGRPRVRISFPNSTVSLDQQLLPQRLVWLAVPEGTDPVLAKVEASEPVLLASGVEVAADTVSLRGRQGQVGLVRKAGPEVALGHAVLYRRFRLCPVQIRPLRYEPQSGIVRLTTRVAVTVRFEPRDPSEGSGETGGQEKPPLFLRQLVLNPEDLSASAVIPERRMNFSGDPWSNAEWFRVQATQAGLVAVPWEVLVAAGADSAALARGEIAVFESSGEPLPEDLSEPERELEAIPYTLLSGRPDPGLGPGDCLVYVARGPVGWRWDEDYRRFRHWVNPYTTCSVAWVVVGGPPGNRMSVESVALSAGETPSETVRRLLHFEQDRELPEGSGTGWVWRYLTPSMIGNLDFQIPDLASPDSAVLRLRLVGLSDTHHRVAVSVNGEPVRQLELAFRRAQEFELSLPPVLHRGQNRLRLYASERGSIVGVDWFEVEAECGATLSTRLDLLGPPGQGTVVLQGVSPESLLVVDVGDPARPRLVNPAREVSGLPVVRLGVASRLIAQRKRGIQRPKFVRKYAGDPRRGHLRDGQNEADYLVITPRAAVETAAVKKLLRARAEQGWDTKAVPLEDVYDQFAWGQVDPAAVRNFLRYAFESWRKAPQWILFVGDATYDVRNVLGLNGELVCPSHESRGSVSDDWFVEWTGDRIPDASVGRLPAKTLSELEALVAKVLAWQKHPPVGLWRVTTTFVADDAYRKREYVPEDEVFERDTESLVRASELADFDVHKIYLEMYRWDAVGNRPEARRAFLSELNHGTVFVNYLGHANWNQIAHETLFQSPDDFDMLQNGKRLPLAFAGTCETARLDDPHFDSIGELALLKRGGGFGGWIGCARWTMHGVSSALDAQLLAALFAPENRGRIPIGNALLCAKIATGFPDQTEAVFLLGDPLARLPLPWRKMRIEISPDTLDAHHRIWIRRVKAESDSSGLVAGGHLAVRLYDAVRMVRTSSGMVSLQGPSLFEGVLSLDSWQGEASFFVTADTLAGGPSGRLIGLAWTPGAEASDLAFGCVDSVVIRPDTLRGPCARDTTAPLLRFQVPEGWLGEEDGQLRVKSSFRLLVTVEDSGCASTAQLPRVWISDLSEGQTWQFGAEMLRSLGVGVATLSWQINDWRLGRHQLRICAEDAAGNRRCLERVLRVVPSTLTISEVLPYPNPADRELGFVIVVNQDAEIEINVFTLAGRRVWTWEGVVGSGQTFVPAGGWHLVDQEGDPLANGVYLFRVRAKSLWQSGQMSVRVGKLAIAR